MAADAMLQPHSAAVEKAMSLPEVSRALARCRHLVSHFNHSSKSTFLLKQKQEDLHHRQHSLLQDVATRWNSAYYMVKRVLEQQQPLCATLLELKKANLMPSDAEFSTMENYVEIMKPLVDITEANGLEKWVTIFTIRPLLHMLLRVNLASKPADTTQQKAIKSAMHSDLKQRYTREMLLLLSKAAFLDPRLKVKSLSFLSPLEKEKLRAAIEEEAAAVSESIESSQEAPAKHLPQKELKESTNFLNCLMMLYSLLEMNSLQLHTSRRLMQK